MHPEFKPFGRLSKPRPVERVDLPPDLTRFYVLHEGVGLESTPDYPVRICRLDEVKCVGCQDVLVLHGTVPDDLKPWERFQGFKIGIDSWLDDVVYVIEAPCCAPGSILLLGPDVAGPGGTGTAVYEATLVLAASLDEWLLQLESFGWVEYGAVPGGIKDLEPEISASLRRHYRKLNPSITW